MAKTKGKLLPFNFPRAPLPRQTGGAHKRKNKVLDRKVKHKNTLTDEYYNLPEPNQDGE